VNSQEWTLSRTTPTINLGILGSTHSLKSTLVHRYLTNHYIHDTSPEGGRFKKELIINGKPYLLLIRDEGGPPELQFTHWIDVLILVANDADSVNTCYSYVSRLTSYKSLNEIPIVLISASANNSHQQQHQHQHDPSFVEQFKKIPHQLYFAVDVVSGKNVEQAFLSACKLILPENATTMSGSGSAKITRRKSNIFNKHNNSSQQEIVPQTRQIPIKQGNVTKKSTKEKLKKTWKKKYLTLTSDKLIYYENINSYMERGQGKPIELKHANVVKNCEKRFTINTLNKVFEFECSNVGERDEWVDAVQRQIMDCLQLGGGFSSREELDFDYDVCADCKDNLNDNLWVSINFGVVICIGCSGIHRNLGCHLSRVRSLQLDQIGYESKIRKIMLCVPILYEIV
jgi:hypothetical protein